MARTITFKGAPLNLVGRLVQENTGAPPFRLVAQDLKEISLGDFDGKTKILTSFPSIDTPVCDLQVKEFNKKAAGFSPDVVVVGISKDLPFAQRRFCDANEIKNVVVASDYRFSSFGFNYGLLIKELALLARAILIVDKKNTIRYIQIVKELSSAPDYEDALRNLEAVLSKPAVTPAQELPGRCTPCEGGVLPLAPEKIKLLIAKSRGWETVDDKKIVREFKFADFVDAKYFVDGVSAIANDQGHHPTMLLSYNKVKITLTTHAAGGLTENDFIMAQIIDQCVL